MQPLANSRNQTGSLLCAEGFCWCGNNQLQLLLFSLNVEFKQQLVVGAWWIPHGGGGPLSVVLFRSEKLLQQHSSAVMWTQSCSQISQLTWLSLTEKVWLCEDQLFTLASYELWAQTRHETLKLRSADWKMSAAAPHTQHVLILFCPFVQHVHKTQLTLSLGAGS